MIKALVLFAPLPCLVSQPEIIRHAQSERDNGEANQQEPTVALFFAKLLGLLGGAFRLLGGGLW